MHSFAEVISEVLLIFFLWRQKTLSPPGDNQDLSSPTMHKTLAPCIGRAESKPLGNQGSP